MRIKGCEKVSFQQRMPTGDTGVLVSAQGEDAAVDFPGAVEAGGICHRRTLDKA